MGLLAGRMIKGSLEILPPLDRKRQKLHSRRAGNQLGRAELDEPYR
jgi:hypothetical protein